MKRKATAKEKGVRQAKTADAQSDLLFANVVLRSSSGKLVKGHKEPITPANVKTYLPSEQTLEEAGKRLTGLGFKINLQATTHITVAGKRELFERIFRVRLERRLAPFTDAPQERDTPTQSYFVTDVPPRIPESLASFIEAVEFPGPVTYLCLTDTTRPPLSSSGTA